jgi:hypothetical protein
VGDVRIHELDDPLLEIWPFLLIVRTGRIVTDHAADLRKGCDMRQYRQILGVPSI